MKFTPLERKFCLIGEAKKYIAKPIRKNISNRSSLLTGCILFGIVFLVLGLLACEQTSPPHKTKLKVLTTIPPLYSFTRNITGELADVDNLLPSGVGPHEYSFSPADIKKIAEADIIIKNGVNLEDWLDKLIVSVRKQAPTAGGQEPFLVDTSSGVDIINNDPHIWLSPRNAIIQTKNIRDALIRADPDSGARYTKNALKYIKRLEKLDKDIRAEVKKWKKKEFVAFHSAFLYFTGEYGLKQIAVIQEFPGKQPAPVHIINVINSIKKRKVKAILSDPQFSHKIVETIANDLKLEVFSIDTLETGALYPESYEDKMRTNLEAFKNALR